MGTWGRGPFDNDAAGDFVVDTDGSPEALAEILRRCADAEPGEYLDADDRQPAIAVCELVAVALGKGALGNVPEKVRVIADKVGRNEDLRLLAIRALARVRDPKHSEIAQLWAHEPAFDARLGDLAERLAGAGP